MRKSDKKPLLDKLNSLSPSDRQRLFQQASRLRKASQSKNRKPREDITRSYRQGQEQQDNFQKRAPQNKPVSLEDWALKLLSEGKFDAKEAATDAAQETTSATVISVKAGKCLVITDDDRQVWCLLRPELAMAQRSELAVGDRVQFSESNQETSIVESVEPRSSVLSRPDPHDNRIERVIVANIDIAVIVGSVASPPLSTNMIDRYLLAVDRGGIRPLICINKLDLAVDDTALLDEMYESLEPYRKLGIDIVYCSADSGQGVSELKDALAGHLAVFVGHSGVGKSSLLNAIEPDLSLETRVVRRVNQKGRHTTVSSNLYHLPGDITIIDTPGVRSFGLWQMEPVELRWYFDEFDQYADSCHFSDCTHTHEPDCAVKAALAGDASLTRRYESYLRMLENICEGGK